MRIFSSQAILNAPMSIGILLPKAKEPKSAIPNNGEPIAVLEANMTKSAGVQKGQTAIEKGIANKKAPPTLATL